MTRSVPILAALISLPLAAPALGQTARSEKPAVTWDAAYSGNYSKGRRQPITKIILHTIEGSTRSGRNLFKSRRAGRRKVSAHYIVSLDGSIVQMVRDSDRAWHIKGQNAGTIGIEHEGFAHRNTWTPEQIRASARLVRWLCDEYEIPADRTHIRGHAEEPGQAHRRSDPGPHFNWDLYIALIRGMAPVEVLTPAPEQVLGRTRIDPELTLRWLAADEQRSYRVQIADAQGGIVHDSGRVASGVDRHTALVDFGQGGDFAWRVHTHTEAPDGGAPLDRESGWTPFKVDLVQPELTLTHPAQGQVVTEPPRIGWLYVKPGVPLSGYRVRVSTSPWIQPGTRVVDTQELNGPADGYQIPNRLEPDTTYHVQVMVHDGRGNMTTSAVRTFRTAPPEAFSDLPPPEVVAGRAEANEDEMQDRDGLTDALGRPVRSPLPKPRPDGLGQ